MLNTNDIDFYVKPQGFPKLLEYIIDHGYEVSISLNKPRSHSSLTGCSVPLNTRSYTSSTHIGIILDMHHRSSKLKKINIIVSLDSHIVTTITNFHSTVVMNFVAWYRLVCLYPHWTMKNVGLVNREYINYQIFDKYQKRGFTLCASVKLIDGNRHRCYRNPYCPMKLRTLNDDTQLFLPFNNVHLSFNELEPNIPWMLNTACVSEVHIIQIPSLMIS